MNATKIFWIIELHKYRNDPQVVQTSEQDLIQLIAENTWGTVCGVYECEVAGACVDRTEDVLTAAERLTRGEAA